MVWNLYGLTLRSIGRAKSGAPFNFTLSFETHAIGQISVNEGNVTFRGYRDNDYSDCETLVDNARGFEKHFYPYDLAILGKYLYTMGSIAMSNYRVVAEHDGKVAGFIFGYNERIPLPKHELRKLSSRLAIFKRLLFMKGMAFREKLDFLNAMGTHEKNRTALLKRGKSEIVLFVVHPAFQGRGIGKKLFEGFRVFCEKANVESIVVETNKLGAASFYERIGFRLIGDFDSPLHNYVTKNGQACLYEHIFADRKITTRSTLTRKKRRFVPLLLAG